MAAPARPGSSSGWHRAASVQQLVYFPFHCPFCSATLSAVRSLDGPPPLYFFNPPQLASSSISDWNRPPERCEVVRGGREGCRAEHLTARSLPYWHDPRCAHTGCRSDAVIRYELISNSLLSPAHLKAVLSESRLVCIPQ